MTNQLYIYKNKSISLQDALKAWKDILAGTMGLVYSAEKCRVLSLTAVQSSDTLKSEMKCPPFEARVFNQVCELRWLADAQSFNLSNWDNNGIAVLLTEREFTEPPAEWHLCNTDDTDYVDSREDHYVLWGEYEKDEGENRIFFEHRMGNLAIPKAAFTWENPQQGKKAALKVKEYIAVGDKHGNCAVIAERLLGFDVLSEK